MKIQCSTTSHLLFTVLLNIALALTIDTYPDGVEAGKSYNLTYTVSPVDRVVTFTLRRGLSTSLTWTSVLGTSNNGTYTWAVSRSLPSAEDYALQITADAGINYSALFGVTNDGSDITSAPPVSSAVPTSSTGGPTSPTSSATTLGGNSQSGLTTAEKAGVGVGASIGALLLVSGAFFLGIFGRKKWKRATVIDTESGSAGEKPELDAKSACHEMTEDCAMPSSKVFELAGQLGQATITHTELDALPRSTEIDSSEVEPPRHELHADTATSASPTPDPQHTEPTGRNINCDSRSNGEFAGSQ